MHATMFDFIYPGPPHFFQQLPVGAIIHSFQCCVVFVSLGNARLEVDNAEHGIHLANLQDAVSGGWSTSTKAQHKMTLYRKYLNRHAVGSNNTNTQSKMTTRCVSTL